MEINKVENTNSEFSIWNVLNNTCIGHICWSHNGRYIYGDFCCCAYLALKCTQPCKLYYILVTAFLQAFITKFDWEALALNLHKRRCVSTPLQCILCNFDLPFALMVYSHYRVNFSVHTIEKKIDTQPIIELFSPYKSWPNSKCECTHLVQYSPLFSK